MTNCSVWILILNLVVDPNFAVLVDPKSPTSKQTIVHTDGSTECPTSHITEEGISSFISNYQNCHLCGHIISVSNMATKLWP